jgi:hypothetical protein
VGRGDSRRPQGIRGRCGAEESAWNAVKNTDDVNTLEDFIRRHPDGINSKSAYLKIKSLKEAAREKKEREEREEARRKLEERAAYSKTFDVGKNKKTGLAGRLYVTLDGIKYTEYGKRSNPINNFVIPCEDIKEAKENRELPLAAMNPYLIPLEILKPPPFDFHLKYWNQKVDLYPPSLSANDKNLILGIIRANCGDRLGGAVRPSRGQESRLRITSRKESIRRETGSGPTRRRTSKGPRR